MEFVTDNWTPLDRTRQRESITSAMLPLIKQFALRHYLAVLSVVLLLLSPVVWLFSETWAPAAICVGLAMVLWGAAVRLAPGVPPENAEA
jgi:hypothetical protein